MQKNGVTLLELLIVIIIIAILVAIGVPVYTYRIERTRGEEAIANIELINDALRMYRVKYEGWPPTGSLDSLSEINTTLGLGLDDPDFDYQIGLIILPESAIRITAERTEGIYDGRRIIYNITPSMIPPEGVGWSASSDWPWMP